mgnify:CR=1 FL=1
MENLFKESQGMIYNGGAILYSIVGYIIGFLGLFDSSIIINILSALLLGHSMIIAAYLIHECAHNLVFKRIRFNNYFGEIFSWICGSSYGTYKDIQHKHFRHHVDVDDVVWFDYEAFFESNPKKYLLTKIFEWFYIPAHEFIMHFIMMFSSFIIPERRNQRFRNTAVIVIRFTMFLALIIYFPKVALLYTFSYILLLTVLRFMDSIQHDYPYNLTLFSNEKPARQGDYEWEQIHTYSNPHSFSIEAINWLTLNFGFHNAHHHNMTVPWYRLPEKHRELFGNNPETVIPFHSQVKIFHKNRVTRIYGNHDELSPEGVDYLIAARKAEVSGGNAASFLTSF